jgi:hypothetical protein
MCIKIQWLRVLRSAGGWNFNALDVFHWGVLTGDVRHTELWRSKIARRYLLYLPISYVLAEKVKYTENTFASASLETCALGGSYFGYSVFPGVMLASSMHSPESLFLDLQQLLVALVL